MKWFRFHSSSLHDPKIQRLSGNDYKAWVNLLCIANEEEPRGSLPSTPDVAYLLQITAPKANTLLNRFIELGLLDLDEDIGRIVLHKWEKWQRNSDNAAERIANKRRTSSEQVLNKF